MGDKFNEAEEIHSEGRGGLVTATLVLITVAALIVVMILAFSFMFAQKDKDTKASEAPDKAALYSFFNIGSLPENVINQQDVATSLSILLRERCDWDALRDFAVGIHQAGYKREAANAFVAYSDKCSEATGALKNAANIFYDLSDYPEALKVADQLVEIDSINGDFHWLRGKIQEDAGMYEAAVDSYTSVLNLEDDLSILSSSVFQNLADSYAALGKYCEAVSTAMSWVSLDPVNNNTRAVQEEISSFSKKGECESNYARGEDRFPVGGPGTIVVGVRVNGIEGRFLVDTGASSVGMTQDFARKAGISLGESYKIPVQTANGIVYAQSVTLERVEVGRVRGDAVSGLVASSDLGSFGDGIDGLLGRSFLSRFNVSFNRHEWVISGSKEISRNK